MGSRARNGQPLCLQSCCVEGTESARADLADGACRTQKMTRCFLPEQSDLGRKRELDILVFGNAGRKSEIDPSGWDFYSLYRKNSGLSNKQTEPCRLAEGNAFYGWVWYLGCNSVWVFNGYNSENQYGWKYCLSLCNLLGRRKENIPTLDTQISVAVSGKCWPFLC